MNNIDSYSLVVTLVLFLILVSILLIVSIWRKNRISKKYRFCLENNLIEQYSNKKIVLKIFLVFSALVLSIISILYFEKIVDSKKYDGNGYDLIFVIDVSNSMLCEDIQPSRLEKAKDILIKVIEGQNKVQNKFGIIVFAGNALLQMPVSTDLEAAKMYINEISTTDIPLQGTIISKALNLVDTAFNLHEKSEKYALVVSDGEDNDTTAINNILIKLREKKIKVFSIGVGTINGSIFKEKGSQELKKDSDGNVLISQLNRLHLQNISSKTEGRYFDLENSKEIAKKINNQIFEYQNASIREMNKIDKNNKIFLILLLCSILFLIIEIFVPDFKSKTSNEF